ncbi:MAG: PAS domain S-box protein [Betaproteobacteria bacterium]|nr:PAS domain S-box protein [Betaproteobacteria bacterium]
MEQSATTPAGAKALRVLVLEDSARDAELIIRELRSFGYDPHWSRVDSEEDFRSHIDAELDLVIADYTLPQFDAPGALAILQEQELSIPFIIVTGTITEETAVTALKQGADDFLLKDRLARLGPAVRNALQQRQLRDERSRAQELLIRSEARFRRLVTRMSALVVELDPKGTILFVNDTVSAVTGYSPEEILSQNAFDLFFPGKACAQLDPVFQILSRGEDLRNHVTLCRTKAGTWISLEWNTANEYRVDGHLQKIIAFGLDITERERAASRIRHLSRLYAATSKVNEALVRSKSPDEVFAAVCRACVEDGDFILAWIGVADQDAQRIVVAEAFGPSVEYLDGIEIATASGEARRTGAATFAYRERQVYICNDFHADPVTAPWSERAARYGIAATIALPFFQGGKAIGTLSVYGGEKDIFNDEAVTLLRRMAENISFALDQFEHQAKREKAEAALRLSEARLQEAQSIGRIGDWELDLETRQLTWSPEMFRILGRDPAAGAPAIDEVLQHYVGDSDDPPIGDLRRAVATGERVQIERRFRLPGRGDACHAIVIVPRKDDDGRVTSVYGTVQDVTERRRLEEQRAADALHLAELSRRVVAVQEEERRRLAAELHDSTSPNLSAVALNLGMIASDLEPSALVAIDSRLADTRVLLADAIASIRDACAELRPATLDYAGLLRALQGHAAAFSRRTGVAVEVSCSDPDRRLAPELESTLFRIVQEALTNAAKHAQATAIDIELVYAGAQIVLTISDNGVGFDPKALGQSERRPGLGLLTMQERAEFAGGKFRLESEPGKGARIRVVI